jgi:G:T-mismatch repair DNA endonuclease (very short patch repair protein)
MTDTIPTHKDAFELYIKFMSKYYNIEFDPSLSFIYKIRTAILDGYSDKFLNDHLNYIRTLKNFVFYWLDKGFSFEEAKYYIKHHKEYAECKYCDILYKKLDGVKTCCCEEHYKEHRSIGNKKLSESRLKYNSRDPMQYAERHKISLEEAEKIVRKISRNSSHWTIDYWLNRGFSEEEAIKNISEIQSINSNRNILHWINKGFSKEEAILKVAEVQSYNSKKLREKYGCTRKFSPWCTEYWINKGLSEEDAKRIISNNSSKASNIYLNNTSAEERRKTNMLCKEYWMEKFPDNWEIEYVKFRSSISSSAFRSILSDEFCLMLNDKFSWLDSHRYFGENEFTRYFKEIDGVFKYDYVDTTLKIVVEFNGDYWHANPAKYEPDSILSFPNQKKFTAKEIWERDQMKNSLLENAGYKVFVVWESDFNNNKELLINEIYEEILNESNENYTSR